MIIIDKNTLEQKISHVSYDNLNITCLELDIEKGGFIEVYTTL